MPCPSLRNRLPPLKTGTRLCRRGRSRAALAEKAALPNLLQTAGTSWSNDLAAMLN